MFRIFNITSCLLLFCAALNIYDSVALDSPAVAGSRKNVSKQDSALQKTFVRNNHFAAISSAVKTLIVVSIPEAEQSLKDAQAMPVKTVEQQKAKALAIQEAKAQLANLATQLAVLVEEMRTMLRIEKVAEDVEFIFNAFGEQVAKDLKSIPGAFGEEVAKNVEFILTALGEHVAEDVEFIPDVFGNQVAEDVEFIPNVLRTEWQIIGEDE